MSIQDDFAKSPEHRVAMEVNWLVDSVNELAVLSGRPSTQALVARDLPRLIAGYTKLGFLLSALNKEAA